MYRQGLGDCFLVTLRHPPRRDFNLMIDCGVILGTEAAGDKLRAVVNDIITATDGFVDVLAVTHEHYDHVAGFVLAHDLFAKPGEPRRADRLSVGSVWFAWTEDPKDAMAARLRKSRQDRATALAGLAYQLDGMGAAEASPEVAGALAFFGVNEKGQGLGATAQAMVNAAGFVADDKVFYHRPGDLTELPDAPGLRFYALGPPADEKFMKKTDSTTEVYHLGLDDLEMAVVAAAAGGPETGDWDPYAPFDSDDTRRLSAILERKLDGPTADFVADAYLGPPAPTPEADISWRRIDGAWLDTAAQLALALDSATNNTSLVLAIELSESGKVLLFPADAQVGNWLSWANVNWQVDGRTVAATDLLNRTVFYKVGHHGSHNATLREKGLELMPTEGLVAFVPVDHGMAVKKHWGKMPLPGLLDALRKRCGEHVVRMDEPPPALADIAAGPDGPFGPMYYEWTLPV
jgi:hypothetical protein